MSALARWLLGWLWWWVLPVRKAVARDNLAQAFPDRGPADLRRAVGAVAWGYVELLIGRDAVVSPRHALPRAGGIGLIAHGGNWDIGLVALGRRRPVTVFVKTPSNPLAARFIRAMRGRSDLELLGVSGTMERAYAALDEGRLVLFFLDQRHNDGLPADFLGRPAWTSAAFAAMAWRTRAPVVGLWPRLAADGTHHLDVEPLDLAVPADRAEALVALTQASQDWLSAKVRQHPDGWWWLHRRWRAPPGATPSGPQRT